MSDFGATGLKWGWRFLLAAVGNFTQFSEKVLTL